MASPQVCHPLAISPPNTDFFAASSSTWNGCGSYSRAKRTMSSFVTVFPPNSRTAPTGKSSQYHLNFFIGRASPFEGFLGLHRRDQREHAARAQDALAAHDQVA